MGIEIFGLTSCPKIWAKCNLGKIATKITKGATPTTYGFSFLKNGINFIKIENIRNNRIDLKSIRNFISEEAHSYQKRSILAENDILFSIAGTIGNTCIIKKDFLPANTNQALAIIGGYSNIVIPKLLQIQLSSFITNATKAKARGGAMNNISLGDLKSLEILIPPLQEQNQIVSKIEELFSELDNGVESLKKAREQLKTYRQAVLKYAFEGKLTQEWREQQIQAGNPPEPAEKLLERIKKEREAHYQKQVEDWKNNCEQAETDGSKKPAKPRKPKDLPPLKEKELAELPELPEGWGWVKVGEVSKNIQYGYTASATSKNIGPKLLRITDIQNNRVDWESVPYCAIKNDEIKKYLLEDGDLVFARTGATVGKSYLITKIKCKSIYASYLIRLRFQIYINNYYIYNFFQSIQYWIQITEDQVGIGQPNVNGSKLSELAIPICSEIEQNIIVQEIESRLSVCDQLEKTIEDSLKKAEALRQSILKKAFEGELTREWRAAHPELISGENSAESLLARIREEKTQLKGIKR